MIVQPTHAPYHTGQRTDWGAGAARIMGALQQFQQQRYEQRRQRELEAAEKDRLMRQAELERSAAGNPQTMQQLAIEARGAGDVATADYLDDKSEDLWARADKEEEQELARLAEQRRVAAQLVAGDRWRQQFEREGRIPHRQIEMVDGVPMHTMRDRETGAFIGTAGRARESRPLVSVNTSPTSWMTDQFAMDAVTGENPFIDQLGTGVRDAVVAQLGRTPEGQAALRAYGQRQTESEAPDREAANAAIEELATRLMGPGVQNMSPEDRAAWNRAAAFADDDLVAFYGQQIQHLMGPDLDPTGEDATPAQDAEMLNQMGL